MKAGSKLIIGLLGLILTLAFCVKALGRPMDDNPRKVMHALYDFRFQDADSLIATMEKAAADDYMPHLMRSHYNWWKLISQGTDEKSRREYLVSLDLAEKVINTAMKGEQYSNSDVFHFINLYALKARLDVINGDYLKAIRHMKNGVDYIKSSLGKESTYPDFYLTSGLYNYMTAYGSKRYPFLAVYALVYPRGDMVIGKTQLQIAALSLDPVIRTEANYFLMKILQELEQDYEGALKHALWLTRNYPNNLIFLYHHLSIVHQLQQNELAEALKNNYLLVLSANPNLNAAQRQYLRSLL